MPENVQWEYRIETIGSFFKKVKPEILEEFLNELGQEGWEATSVHHPQNSNQIWITIKRPVTRSTRRRRSLPEETW